MSPRERLKFALGAAWGLLQAAFWVGLVWFLVGRV